MDNKIQDPLIPISLLIPVYNGEEYIISFCEHIQSLKGAFAEVIFYNDASSDNTAQLLAKSGYRYVNAEENNGPGYARNRLAELANSPYIHFHDIDDEFDPNFIGLVSERIVNTNADVILGNADWINQQSRELEIRWTYNEDELQKDPLQYFIGHPLGIINTVYKRTFFLGINGFDEEINCWEDADVHVKLAKAGATFSVINKTLAFSIRHNNGISKQDFCVKCRFKFLKRYLKEFSTDYEASIMTEIDKCAKSFYSYGFYDLLKECEILAKQKGMRLPLSHNKFLNTLKAFNMPLSILILIQNKARNPFK